MHRFLWTAVLLVPGLLRADPPSSENLNARNNVISAAEDAFGIILGPESLGLYSPSSVRGFNPLLAGNVRINGLYFDQQGSVTDRLIDRTQIQVGLAAIEFPWPAPTGIVDYTLRPPKDVNGLSTTVYAGPYAGREVDVDGYQRFWGDRAGIAGGVSYLHAESVPGLTSRVTSFGILPQWSPQKDVTVRSFWGRQNVSDLKTQPSLYLGIGQQPPHIPTRYFGQAWTQNDWLSELYGILIQAPLSPHWSVRTGVFHSISELPRTFADLYLNTSSTGIAEHTLIAEPDQHYGSTSGELRLSYIRAQKAWRQQLDMRVKARNMTARYGGGGALDLGVGLVGQVKPLPRQGFRFGTRTRDQVQEYSLGASYNVQWNKNLDFTLGLQQPNYSRHITDPALGRFTTAVRPWLYNSSLVLRPTKRVALFGALTRGLEDSGFAPANAANRGAVLGAVSTSQQEVGIKYALSRSVSLVCAAFDIHKPYFALDAGGVFANLGKERHRGAEVSLAGEVLAGLNIVAGATVLSPEVTTQSSAETIGKRPVGQPTQMEQLSINYRLPNFPHVSLDGYFTYKGARMARVDNRAEIAAYSAVNLGSRYQRSFGHHSMSLRVQLLNATNSHNWYVANDGSLALLESRRALAYIVFEF